MIHKNTKCTCSLNEYSVAVASKTAKKAQPRLHVDATNIPRKNEDLSWFHLWFLTQKQKRLVLRNSNNTLYCRLIPATQHKTMAESLLCSSVGRDLCSKCDWRPTTDRCVQARFACYTSSLRSAHSALPDILYCTLTVKMSCKTDRSRGH